ncbi:MAG TPA: hypothetical protein VJ304_01475, partial [Flavobacterium sp.]|nr:hypothetical protein [Flavobacterium sp.]
ITVTSVSNAVDFNKSLICCLLIILLFVKGANLEKKVYQLAVCGFRLAVFLALGKIRLLIAN